MACRVSATIVETGSANASDPMTGWSALKPGKATTAALCATDIRSAGAADGSGIHASSARNRGGFGLGRFIENTGNSGSACCAWTLLTTARATTIRSTGAAAGSRFHD
jgi:hypothetical protein